MLFAVYSFQWTEKAGRDLAGKAREKADLIQKAIKIASTNQQQIIPKGWDKQDRNYASFRSYMCQMLPYTWFFIQVCH